LKSFREKEKRILGVGERKCEFCNLVSENRVVAVKNTLRDPYAYLYRTTTDDRDMDLPNVILSFLFLGLGTDKNLFWTIGSFLDFDELLGRLRLCNFAFRINFGMVEDKSFLYRTAKTPASSLMLKQLPLLSLPMFERLPRKIPESKLIQRPRLEGEDGDDAALGEEMDNIIQERSKITQSMSMCHYSLCSNTSCRKKYYKLHNMSGLKQLKRLEVRFKSVKEAYLRCPSFSSHTCEDEDHASRASKYIYAKSRFRQR